MTDTALPARPELSITVGDRTIKMTYGLEMDIRRLLPDPLTTIQSIQSDVYTQDYIVRRLMTDKNKIITNPDDLIDAEEITLDSDEVETLLGWVAEHALYFFVKRTVAMGQLGVRYQTVLPKPSTDGSENSPSKTPSAGLSDASKETSTTTTSGDTLDAS